MRTWRVLYGLLLLFACGFQAKATDEVRQVVNFNAGWLYRQGDVPGAGQPTYADDGWERVGLPHSFSIPYFMSRDFYVGYGWYRKTWELTRKQLEKQHFLEFDGVFCEAEIYVNGQKAGHHEGGYTGFSVNITPYLKAGQNLVAVRVNNLWNPDRAPRAGEHVFSGGIYRNVHWVMKSPLYIDWCGTGVTTPDLQRSQGKSAAVHVATDVCNAMKRTAGFRLQTDVVDAEGRTVASVSDDCEVAPGAKVQVRQVTPEVHAPKLWSPDTPYLYKVVTTLYRGKKVCDRSETTFGFRWTEWTADEGFFLNGKHLYLRGANVHQDHAGWGDAVTEAGSRRDVRLMKEAGFNFIRGSHYPHSPAFVDACDREGILFWSENAFWGTGGFREDGCWNAGAYPSDPAEAARFDESVKAQLAEMIRIHRNHPSVIVWSMCNEAFFSAPETMDGVRRLLSECVELSHQLDSTRPAAIGGAQRPIGEGRIDKIGDVAGYNGDGGIIPDFQQPGVPSMVSEYGSVTADRPGKYEPGWGDLQRDESYKGRRWRGGQAVWCGFDHGSIAGGVMAKMGIVDYFRIPKRSWYWYRNEYTHVAPPEWPVSGVPARLSLTADRTEGVRTDGTDDVMLCVEVCDAGGRALSNSLPVTFTIVSGPGEFPTGRSITFAPDSDIRIQDGKAAIELRAYESGRSVVVATAGGLQSDTVCIDFVGERVFREGVTPLVADRPYVRFVRPDEGPVQTFGPGNPTFASSQGTGHTSGSGADGDVQTFWQAADGDSSPWWISDTEKGLSLRRVRLVFPTDGGYRYALEVSADREQWTKVGDERSGRQVEKARVYDFPSGTGSARVRFVRVRFTEQSAALPAAVSEIEIQGCVAD